MLASLWLPIVLSAVVLFFASFLSWMILQLHKDDWRKVDREDEFLAAVRPFNLPDGSYMFPRCSGPEEMKSEAFQAKYKAGPRGIMTILAPTNMGVNLAMTLTYFLVVSLGLGYLAGGTVLAIMILPTITSIAIEVLQTVPGPLREAALALGATRWEAIRIAVLPYARAGIVGATMLGLGRALGETMAVTMVIGNSPTIRARIAEKLGWLGVVFDPAANAGGKSLISRPESRVALLVVPTDEELMIAQHTLTLLPKRASATVTDRPAGGMAAFSALRT